MKQQLIDFYIDWVNNFVSISSMADHYGLSDPQVRKLIDIGRELNDEAVKVKKLTISI